uniref:SUN domain-containing protein n=1 Tax=Glossina palpalis gambiensis TaxID=67801 RepID=A0A1B0BRQ3_9MUSC
MISCRRYYVYAASILMIAFFIYTLIAGSLRTSKEIDNLRENFEEMAHSMLSKADVQNDRHMLMNTLDGIIKEVFSSVRDELYTLKKAIRGAECPNNAPGKTSVKIHERVNYASEDLGAKVVSVMAQPLYSSNFFELLLGIKYWPNPPVKMLRSNMAPGNCFAFKDDRAVVMIKLPRPVMIDQIGLSHISRKQSPTGDASSAPKDFTVFAVTENRDVLLGNFRYECIQTKLLQTFFVQPSEKYDLLRFHFNSNHGHSAFTCIYRIVVYGRV